MWRCTLVWLRVWSLWSSSSWPLPSTGRARANMEWTSLTHQLSLVDSSPSTSKPPDKVRVHCWLSASVRLISLLWYWNPCTIGHKKECPYSWPTIKLHLLSYCSQLEKNKNKLKKSSYCVTMKNLVSSVFWRDFWIIHIGPKYAT